MPKSTMDDRFRQAMAAHRSGDLATAKAGYDAILAAEPDHVGALQLLGSLALQTGHREPALALFRRVAALRPDVAESHNNLAAALVALGRHGEALKAFGQAIARDPRDPSAVSNMGVALFKLGRTEQALICHRKAVNLAPGFALGHQRMGEVLDRLGEISDAIGCFHRALDLAPPTGEALSGLGNALLKQGAIVEAVEALREAARLLPDHQAVVGNLALTLLYDERATPETLWHAHRGWAERFAMPKTPPAPHGNDRQPDRRLRIGYVSPDFRRHSVAHFLDPLLTAHDRSQVSIHAYAEVARADDRTERFRGLCDGWCDTVGMADGDLAARIRADRIDVLVDLAGLFNGNRLTMFGRKPAPVQIGWLGYPQTSGLDAMDARVGDALLTPRDGQERFSETLVNLPRPYVAYAPPPDAPLVSAPPCLDTGRITFGSFNNLSKTGPATIALWSHILRAVPNSRLLLKSSGGLDARSGARFTERFAAHAIDPDRIETVGFIDDPTGHLALYGRIDIGLDPHPYNGTTTTCEALWMGVPVVSLAGNMSRSRNGVTLLSAVGLADCVAPDAVGYVDRAVGLARDPRHLADLRSRLRAAMASSQLCDADGFAREIESLYRRLWRDWIETAGSG